MLANDPKQLDPGSIEIIFDQLDFEDLLTIAEVSSDFHFFADRAFKRNFAHKKICFGNFVFKDPPNKMDRAILKIAKVINRFGGEIPINMYTVESDSIRIQSVFYGMKTLKYFGKSIRSLKLSLLYADVNAAKFILQYVDKYCSDTLLELDIWYGDVLGHFQNPFSNLKKLNFVHDPNYSGVTWPSNRTFPALRELTLSNFNDDQVDFYFPFLEHLAINRRYHRQLPLLKKLINANSHIRSFTCERCEQEIVKYASTKLPQLENLTLANFAVGSDAIRFETVQRFTVIEVRDFNLQPRFNIHLPNMQELHVRFYDWPLDSLESFLQNYQNLSRFYLHYNWLDDSEFARITSKLPNMEEMSFLRDTDSTWQDSNGLAVLRLLTNHQKLTKFHLSYCTERDEKLFRDQLNGKWVIQDNERGLSFQREN